MEKKAGIINTIRSLHGNAKPCIWTEWMWAIPNSLYAAYATLYMKEIGLSLTQIGMVSSLCLAVQVVAALLSGVITDKMGRRLTTAVFDCISWGIPVILWTFARSYVWFVAAAFLNGLWRMTGVSFGLLMAEDQDHEDLVGIFSVNQAVSLLSAFFALITFPCIKIWGLVPTIRVIYGVSIFLYFAKFIILYFQTQESDIGIARMLETKDKSIFSLLWDCRKVFWRLLRSREMLLTMGILIAYNLVQTLNTNFWAVMVTTRIGISEENISLFTTLKSMIQLIIIFTVVPRISSERFRSPLLYGWAAFALSQLIVIIAPANAGASVMLLLVLSVALEAFALACMYPVMQSLLFINSDPKERSRILGMIYAVMVLVMSFFPTIAGGLSENNICAPMYINLILFALGSVMTCALWNVRRRNDAR